ncbi:MAG: hypothetical protein JST73_04515, partial [Actinobacteria bacterium]|nr:hypothetical protein [Actinomycetota bacterium]
VPDAAQVARRAANVAPEDPRVHVALALVALDARDPAAGERHAREALAQDPTDVRALDALGVSLARQGRRDEALHYFRTVASERPDDDRIRRNAALVSRALPVEWRFAIMVAVLIGVPVLAVLGQPTWTMVPLWGVAALGAWRALTTLMTRNATSGDPKATRKQRRAIQRQTKAEARSLHPVRKSLFAVLLVVATPMTLIVAIVVGDQTSWVLGVAIFAVYGMFVGWFIRRPASGWAERRG